MSDLMLDVGQAKEIKDALRRETGSNGSVWTNERIKAATEKHGLFGGILDVLDGRAKIVPILSSPIIRVDRSIRPIYPNWVEKLMHPELENIGPAEFDVRKLKHWIHDGQKKDKYAEAIVIYEHVKKNNMLASCLGLRDGEEIKKKGRAFFRKYFKKTEESYLWKSAVLGRSKVLCEPCSYVPFLCQGDGPGNVAIKWKSMYLPLLENDTTLCFKHH